MKSGLILEDLNDMQGWHESLLQEVFPGIQCRRTGTLAGALALIGTEQFDIALIDLGLPDGCGTQAITHLRQQQEQALCIVVTIYDDNDHLFPALKAGAQGYLLKDQSREQFIHKLLNIANGEPPLSPAISRRLLAHFEEQPAAHPETVLTNRELEVLVLISKGLTLPKVAAMLDITRNTAAGHVKSIYRKLNISSRAEAVLEAGKIGLISY